MLLQAMQIGLLADQSNAAPKLSIATKFSGRVKPNSYMRWAVHVASPNFAFPPSLPACTSLGSSHLSVLVHLYVNQDSETHHLVPDRYTVRLIAPKTRVDKTSDMDPANHIGLIPNYMCFLR